jgi:hypothetical protein
LAPKEDLSTSKDVEDKQIDDEKISSFGSRDGSPEFREEEEEQSEVHPTPEVVAH